jgi:hypothetical protein
MNSTLERCKQFIYNDYDIPTKIMTLSFIRGELNKLDETKETLYLKDVINQLIDRLVDD